MNEQKRTYIVDESRQIVWSGEAQSPHSWEASKTAHSLNVGSPRVAKFLARFLSRLASISRVKWWNP